MSALNSIISVATSPAAAPQSPLQLNDIHLPEQVSNLPAAYGWWMLLALLIVILVLAVKKFRKNSKLQQSKRHALNTLNKNMTIAETISLLKWSAMQYFDRNELASLYGTKFQQFLVKQLPEKYQASFKSLSDEAFAAQYQQAGDTTNKDLESSCQQAAKLWLTHALPVKNKELKA